MKLKIMVYISQIILELRVEQYKIFIKLFLVYQRPGAIFRAYTEQYQNWETLPRVMKEHGYLPRFFMEAVWHGTDYIIF